MAKAPTRHLHPISFNPNDWTQEWMRALGFIAYYFGQLEFASVWLADHLGISVSSAGFSERCVDARKRLVSSLVDNTLRAEWEAFFRSAERCAAMRNNIMHNPLEVNAQQLAQTGIDETKGIMLLKKPGRPVLLLADVQTYKNDLIVLHHSMLDLMKRTIIAVPPPPVES